MNHILSLQAPYPLLLEGYSRSAKRNIRKALDNGITIREDIHPAEVIEMHRNRFKDEVGYTSEDYARFTKLSESYYQAGKCICVGASMADKMIASGIFLKDDHRIYFVMNGNKEENLETGAAHLLIDHIIRKYAGSEMILDFEGSDHESFARFYKQYGAVQEPYPFLCIDRLPFLIQMVRRLRIFFSGKQ
jgi:hypothetical protein